MKLNKLEKNATAASRLLKSLASKPRLMVLCQLIDGEKTAGELWEASQLSQSALSQHLAKLRAENLVQTRKEAQTVYYRLESTEVEKLIKTLHSIYCK